MKACHVTITTTTDGKEREISRTGKFALSPLSAEIVYEEENAEISLTLKNGVVTLTRKGDYTLDLRLEKGKNCDGAIGLAGAEGAMQTQTSRIAYSQTETTLLLSLHYALLFGEEKQKIKLRLFAKEIRN